MGLSTGYFVLLYIKQIRAKKIILLALLFWSHLFLSDCSSAVHAVIAIKMPCLYGTVLCLPCTAWCLYDTASCLLFLAGAYMSLHTLHYQVPTRLPNAYLSMPGANMSLLCSFLTLPHCKGVVVKMKHVLLRWLLAHWPLS